MSLDKLTDNLLDSIAEQNFGRFSDSAESFIKNRERFKDIITEIALKDVSPVRETLHRSKNPYQVRALTLCFSYIACSTSMGFTKEDIKALVDDVWTKCQEAFDTAAEMGLPIEKEYIEAGMAKPEVIVKNSRWGRK